MQKGIKTQNLEGQAIFTQKKGDRRTLVLKDLTRQKNERCARALLEEAKRQAKQDSLNRKANYGRYAELRKESTQITENDANTTTNT